MSDCPNIEMREMLPEYLHGRLGAADRSRVEVHVSQCEECTAELATLKAVRQAYARVPALDTAAIVRALPRPGRQVVRAPRRVAIWQIAAAFSFISIGGISLVVARSFFEGPGAVVEPGTRSVTAVSVDSPRVIAAVPAAGAARPGISFGGGVDDLETEDLEALLGAIESLEAAPPVEPDLVPHSGAGRVKSDTSGGAL